MYERGSFRIFATSEKSHTGLFQSPVLPLCEGRVWAVFSRLREHPPTVVLTQAAKDRPYVVQALEAKQEHAKA